jgi:hypothetical protein
MKLVLQKSNISFVFIYRSYKINTSCHHSQFTKCALYLKLFGSFDSCIDKSILMEFEWMKVFFISLVLYGLINFLINYEWMHMFFISLILYVHFFGSNIYKHFKCLTWWVVNKIFCIWIMKVVFQIFFFFILSRISTKCM